jgi:hypothetical protein
VPEPERGSPQTGLPDEPAAFAGDDVQPPPGSSAFPRAGAGTAASARRHYTRWTLLLLFLCVAAALGLFIFAGSMFRLF